jgi:NADH-quinone oxidoreductase subunit N
MIIDGNNLFVIFLFLELVNLCIYCLIGLNKDSNLGIESAYKYFVQSSVATIIGFFGISLIYISAGTLNLNELSILMTFNDASWLFILGIYLITSSIFFKLGVFPLHS